MLRLKIIFFFDCSSRDKGYERPITISTGDLPACLCVLEGRLTKSRSIEWLRKQRRRLLCVANTAKPM
jgi:hypothetical protein